MSEPIDKYLEEFKKEMKADLAEGVGGNSSMRRASTENLKRGFEIFIEYLAANKINTEAAFRQAIERFDPVYPMDKLFAETLDMMRKGIKWSTKDGKLGHSIDSNFNKAGFEIFLKFSPENARKFKGIPTNKKRTYLPEDSEFIQASLMEPIIAELSTALDGTETDAEIKILAEDVSFEELQQIIDIQGSDGNWNYDSYMHGLYNGLICARDTLRGVEPEYKSAPESWLSDIEAAAIESIDGTETDEEMEAFAEYVLSNWARKIDFITHVTDEQTVNRKDVGSIPTYTDYELYGRDVDDKFPISVEFLHIPEENLFILKTEEYGDYLIDTQGYDYARYIKKVVD